MTVVSTDYQESGRGQATNKWESEAGKNLLFSILVHPRFLQPKSQFQLSMLTAIVLHDVLTELVDEGITIKWPNDIYWRDRKISGTLIECDITTQSIRNCIIGVGLNVNQSVFKSDAPNPVSLLQITDREHSCQALLGRIVECFEQMYDDFRRGKMSQEDISCKYNSLLYRKDVSSKYSDAEGMFIATLKHVEYDGRLVLIDTEGKRRRYGFKEVEYIHER